MWVLVAEVVEGAEAKLEAPAATRPPSGKEPQRSRKVVQAVVEAGGALPATVETSAELDGGSSGTCRPRR